MASYTIEDIELIRQKSGISYQEAVALLDYHNGNVARALVDLERNGRIKPESQQQKKKQSKQHAGANSFFSRLYRCRIKVAKDSIPILNVSLLYGLISLLIAPYYVLISLVVILCLGYRISWKKDDPDFASANLEKMVRNAAQNVKDTVSDMAQEFTSETSEPEPQPQSEKRSYYEKSAASTAYSAHEDRCPTMQVPVQVESQDGKVTVESDRDGFTSATIE